MNDWTLCRWHGPPAVLEAALRGLGWCGPAEEPARVADVGGSVRVGRDFQDRPLAHALPTYCDSSPMIATSGMNMATTMKPTTTPRNTISTGSSALVKLSSAASTSDS